MTLFDNTAIDPRDLPLGGMKQIHLEKMLSGKCYREYFLAGEATGHAVFMRLVSEDSDGDPEILWYHATLTPLPASIARELELGVRK